MGDRQVLVECVRAVGGEAAQLADVDLVASLFVSVGQLQPVQFAGVRLEGTALSEGLVALRASVRTDTCLKTQAKRCESCVIRSNAARSVDSGKKRGYNLLQNETGTVTVISDPCRRGTNGPVSI